VSIPKDLKIDGKETLTATVTFDTQKLYGKVTAQKTITVYK
jgi:hypothetical protein